MGFIAVSVGVNFYFGTSFGLTGFDSILYGNAARLADILMARSISLVAI